VLAGEPFQISSNDYDWLGPGIYFWQANPQRALQFAEEKRLREGEVWKPTVIGAVIDPGLCLDLATDAGIEHVRAAHDVLIETLGEARAEVPRNQGGTDLLLRKLDCAVITLLHDIRRTQRLEPIDTIAGVFVEGPRIYDNAGFFTKTHIQICVRNARQIKGVFRVSEEDLE
jgi:hypothetical protein